MNVSILVVRAFLEIVAERGIPHERFLSAAGLDPGRLDDLDGRLALSEFDRLQEAALELTGDPALGIHMGERASAPAYDVVGYLASHASTLRESIETLLRFSRLLSDVTLSLAEQGEVATITFAFRGHPDSPPIRLRTELTVTGFVRLLRTFCGEGIEPRQVLFEHKAPAYRAEYARFFGGRERFEQPITALRFDRALLSQQALHKNPRLKALLTSEAERMLDRLERGTMHAERVRDVLAAWDARRMPNMSAVARHLGMSVRSLRRRLDEEGASFPKLLDEAHAAFAKRLLDGADRTIGEVAFDMGFSDPTAFHRAFRRWTGMTPNQYRSTRR